MGQAKGSLRDCALWYVRHLGWQLFPCHSIEAGSCTCGNAKCSSPGKHPRTEHGVKEASVDEKTIERWWSRWPSANIGLATGAASGVDVLDIDPRNYGDETLYELEQKNNSLPVTITSLTGGGGSHLLFEHVAGLSNTELGAGLDIKTDGGYVILPPSTHVSGRAYTWEGASRPGETSLSPWPQWLRELALKRTRKRGAARPVGKKIPAGQRNNTLISLAGSMRRRGLAEVEIAVVLTAVNSRRCSPPLTEEEIHKIAESAGRYPPGKTVDTSIAAVLAPKDSWARFLIVNRDFSPKPLLANVITVLRTAPEWQGVLAFNEFNLTVAAIEAPPWAHAGPIAEWTDQEDRLTANWLQHHGILVSVEIAGQGIQAVARDRPFHPVRQYLQGLRWDGVHRIDQWLSVYLGTEQTDYTAAVGSRWLISAVARIFQPGCQADCCLILEGPQGIRKSTALRTLAGDWFTDAIPELGTKDACLQTIGVWIIELSELTSLNRVEADRTKAFMSRSVERFRPPYGRRTITAPRQCVFAGSLNQAAYLRDETGARRFWPVACGTIGVDELAGARDQLWAEAVVRYRAGAVWWLETPELARQAQDEQGQRYEDDPWTELIVPWLECRSTVSVAEILTDLLAKRKDQWLQVDKNRVARCLRALGWSRFRQRVGDNLQWRYRKGEGLPLCSQFVPSLFPVSLDDKVF